MALKVSRNLNVYLRLFFACNYRTYKLSRGDRITFFAELVVSWILDVVVVVVRPNSVAENVGTRGTVVDRFVFFSFDSFSPKESLAVTNASTCLYADAKKCRIWPTTTTPTIATKATVAEARLRNTVIRMRVSVCAVDYCVQSNDYWLRTGVKPQNKSVDIASRGGY